MSELRLEGQGPLGRIMPTVTVDVRSTASLGPLGCEVVSCVGRDQGGERSVGDMAACRTVEVISDGSSPTQYWLVFALYW